MLQAISGPGSIAAIKALPGYWLANPTPDDPVEKAAIWVRDTASADKLVAVRPSAEAF